MLPLYCIDISGLNIFPFPNPLSEFPSRLPNIYKAWSAFQHLVRVPHIIFINNPISIHERLFALSLNSACPHVPLDRSQLRRAQHEADADDKGSDDRFNTDIQRQGSCSRRRIGTVYGIEGGSASAVEGGVFVNRVATAE